MCVLTTFIYSLLNENTASDSFVVCILLLSQTLLLRNRYHHHLVTAVITGFYAVSVLH